MAMQDYTETTEAMAGKRAGADNWRLSDSLAKAVPQGSSRYGFDSVRRAAESAGVAPYSVSALRQYRDLAVTWPEAERVPGVSFSAHRVAARVPGTLADRRDLLEDLAKRHGPAGVTVGIVEDAVRALQGKPSKATAKALAKAPATAPSVPALDSIHTATVAALVAELVARGQADRTGTEDALAKSPGFPALAKAFEDMAKAKASRSATASQWAGTGSKAKAGTPAKAKAGTTAKGKAGDVRGL